MLRARGREETLILGSDTLRPMVRALIPGVEVVSRPRFSTLRYAGSAKLSRLPPRSAIVAFSAEQVYALAEMLRRLHISAAVDAHFLSPSEEPPLVGEDMDTEEIIAAYRGATDPGLRRSYVEVARRLGEVDGREELEMWALQEESR